MVIDDGWFTVLERYFKICFFLCRIHLDVIAILVVEMQWYEQLYEHNVCSESGRFSCLGLFVCLSDEIEGFLKTWFVKMKGRIVSSRLVSSLEKQREES